MALYSRDHGLYFPASGSQKAWTREQLIYKSDEPMLLADETDDLSPGAIDDVAAALDNVAAPVLAEILNDTPRSWPVSDDDLEALGWFLEHRAPQVAERIRALK